MRIVPFLRILVLCLPVCMYLPGAPAWAAKAPKDKVAANATPPMDSPEEAAPTPAPAAAPAPAPAAPPVAKPEKKKPEKIVFIPRKDFKIFPHGTRRLFIDYLSDVQGMNFDNTQVGGQTIKNVQVLVAVYKYNAAFILMRINAKSERQGYERRCMGKQENTVALVRFYPHSIPVMLNSAIYQSCNDRTLNDADPKMKGPKMALNYVNLHSGIAYKVRYDAHKPEELLVVPNRDPASPPPPSKLTRHHRVYPSKKE